MTKQNGGYGSVPQSTIDQLGITPDEYARKKRNRKRLFIGLGFLSAIAFFAIMFSMLGGTVGVAKTLVFDSLLRLDDKTADSVPSGCETTVMIVRHCEKDGAENLGANGDHHCTYIGFERAAYFASLFGENGYPAPSELYALNEDRGGHKTYREIEMLLPLANKFGLEVNSEYSKNEKLAKDIFQQISSGQLCGKTVVVSWKHEFISELARHLACHECPRYFPNLFDPIWELKYVYDVKGTLMYQKINGVPQEQKSNSEAEEGGEDRRFLKHKKHHRLPRHWSVYWSDMSQNFDPLKFSNIVGDYQGNDVADGWAAEENVEM
jgi:hypothetical protein